MTLLIGLLLFTGCSGNGDSETRTEVEMVIGQSYTVVSKDIYTPTSDDANITIRQNIDNGSRSITLLSGTAVLSKVVEPVSERSKEEKLF